MRHPMSRPLIALIAAALLSPAISVYAQAPAAASKAPAAASKVPAKPQAATQSDPKAAKASALAFIQALHLQFDHAATSSTDLTTLHEKIREQMMTFMDYTEMSRRTLGKKRWAKLKESQRDEFTKLLEAMVQRTYVKRFKPGRTVKITYNPKIKLRKDGRAQVRTVLQFDRTSADVNYSMVPVVDGWKVYDIVVDDASQVHIYRRSFSKILKQEGWSGLMTRMRKSANKGE